MRTDYTDLGFIWEFIFVKKFIFWMNYGKKRTH
nr:MAG TPA: hypothetical protein [Caudoviricetes sp.]